ncbi:MAG: DegT/DnrJ/EryC1/StrS family aminotransferase [bacterium]
MDYNLIEPSCDERDLEEIKKALEDIWLINGPRVEEFEDQIKDHIGVPRVESVTSCTAGIHLVLLALGIGPGDEVIVPAFSFPSDGTMVKMTGAKPVFVDVDPETCTIHPKNVEQAVTSDTKAIVAVDYSGLSCDLDPLVSIANQHDLHIIQDSATSFGGRYKGQPVGNYENVTSILSFGPIKMITTAGMGGMVCSHDEELMEKLPSLKSYGMDEPSYDRQESEKPWYYDVNELGHNYRMTDIAASMGIAQLDRLKKFKESRRTLAKQYDELLSYIEGITPPPEPEGYERAYLYYSVQLAEDKFSMTRDEFASELHERGIGVSVHWAKPLYQQRVFSDLDHESGDFPVADHLADHMLSLPMYSKLSKKDVEIIVNTMREIINEEE